MLISANNYMANYLYTGECHLCLGLVFVEVTTEKGLNADPG